LTQKQQLVLAFIQRYFQENRRYPLIREVQAGCQITSYKSALDRLNALDRKGYIQRLPNKHRGIRLRKVHALDKPKQEMVAA
jgi:SOS-response transcriptional repressor LexA